MADKEIVEADWTTASGYPAVVTQMVVGPLAWRCGGYVGVPQGHKCHGRDYHEMDAIRVHGGLMFSGDFLNVKNSKGFWWFGYNCAHDGDFYKDTTRWTLRACKLECESLGTQLLMADVSPNDGRRER